MLQSTNESFDYYPPNHGFIKTNIIILLRIYILSIYQLSSIVIFQCVNIIVRSRAGHPNIYYE